MSAVHGCLWFGKTLQVLLLKCPLRRPKFFTKIDLVPGAQTPFGRVFENMDVLCRHITLGQHEYFLSARCLLGYIDDNHGMAGEAALNEHVADPHLTECLNVLQFLLKRIASGIHEDGIEIGLECAA